jgi:DNA-binding IclR family transcriptional regulator
MDGSSLSGSAAVIDPDGTMIQSIGRAANVLALLNENTRSLTPALVSERLGLNRTTAHRYLYSLQRAGFLSAAYGPGPLLDQLSALVSVRQQILTYAPPIMRALADATGLTTVLSFLGRTGAVVTLVEEAHEGTIVLTVRVGTVLPLRAAQTRVLLAFQSDPAAVTRAHAGLTVPETATEQTVLNAARRDRVAWADLDHEGLASVAAPVFAPHEVQAAMALIGTLTMLRTSDRSAERVELLRQAAQTLSSMVAR